MTAKTEAIDPLENAVFTPVDAPKGPAQEQQQAEADEAAQQEAQMLQAVSLGVSKIVFAGLRALRSAISKSMPEILEEWPDEVLRGPADAAAPVLQKYMERITALAGRNPELAMLVVALVPLAMGYVSAVEKHSRTIEAVPVKAPT
ncbi:hypothetical protein LJR129_002481 [Acidovorax sp. LjRoot129]|uniref:hypothetical protein n=1 Tax=Acidovorax sp. LjRoot129 TaxID=3342260 RepID=UPI003ECCFE09